jgi:tetratricopeptide (TPR) repeat protein
VPWWSFLTTQRDRNEDTPDYYLEGLDLARQERFHEALTSLRLALRERPGDVATLEQMAVVYTKMGMTDEAIKMYQRALEKNPRSAGAHYGLAFLYLNRGRSAEAAHHLEEFLAGGPDTAGAERHVQHARETLQELRAAPDEASLED